MLTTKNSQHNDLRDLQLPAVSPRFATEDIFHNKMLANSILSSYLFLETHKD